MSERRVCAPAGLRNRVIRRKSSRSMTAHCDNSCASRPRSVAGLTTAAWLLLARDDMRPNHKKLLRIHRLGGLAGAALGRSQTRYRHAPVGITPRPSPDGCGATVRLALYRTGQCDAVLLSSFGESFNGRMRDECLNEILFISSAYTRFVLAAWRHD